MAANIEKRWRFPKKRRVDPNVDPFQGEFFAPVEGLVDALVRESIQNSLDAGRGKGPIRVRFALFEDTKALPPQSYSKYLTGLWEHLESLEAEFPAQDEPMSFLVIEDFGTIGLTGDPTQSADVPFAEEKNHFYYFWRNIGRSEKTETDLGRWGLGKTVFPAASVINSFFGLTVRDTDERKLLMGQSVLKMHQIGNDFFTAYGGFGVFEQDDFVMPIENVAVMREFSKDFRLERTTEPGLSIVIPFFRGDEIDIGDIIRAVVAHYFYPILTEDLIVEFSDGTLNEIATGSTLDELASKYRRANESVEDIKKMFDLARWVGTNPEHVELKKPGEHAPYWGDHLVDDQDLERLRARYDAGDLLALRVPVPIKAKIGDRQRAATYFDMYLQRDDAAQKGQRYYIRRGITIPNKDVMRVAGARGLVVINDPILSSFLGDAENPAHTDWNEKSQKIKSKYVYANAVVRFVKTSFDEAVTLLSRPPEGIEEDLLKDVFSIEFPTQERDSKSPTVTLKKPEGPTQPPVITIPARNPAGFSLDRAKGGFTVHGTGETSLDGKLLRITTAYNVSRGNPMSRYRPFDFELDKSPIAHNAVGCKLVAIGQNHAEFELTSNDFKVDFHGFDKSRDLRVKANVVETGE